MERTTYGDRLPACRSTAVVVNELTKCLDLLKELQLAAKDGEIVGEISACVLKALAELAPPEVKMEKVGSSAATSPSSEVENSDGSIINRSNWQGPNQKKKTIHRRRSHPYMMSTETRSSLEDGYTWRKYGQKEIHCSRHPRSYYRCTYKKTRGCKATRQAQKSEEDESTYLITYIGHHTCNNHPPSSSTNNSRLISFDGGESSTVSTLEPVSFPLLKKEEVKKDHQDAIDGFTPDCFMSLPELETSLPITTTLTSDTVSEHGDVVSGFFKMDYLVDDDDDSTGFSDLLLNFDFDCV